MKHLDPKEIIKRLTNPKRPEIEFPEKVWDVIHKTKPRVILELGVGTGFYTKVFADKGPEYLKIIACDVVKDLLFWINRNLSSDCLKKIYPVLISDRFPVKGRSVDLVFMANLHHELDDRVLFLEKTIQVLKPEGSLVIIDWKKKESPIGPPLDERLTREEIEQDLAQVGMKNITYYDFLPFHYFFTSRFL